MRKITQQAIAAFNAARPFKSSGPTGKTEIEVNNISGHIHVMMKLHGHLIASKRIKGDVEELEVSLCGWNTPLTRERLNAIPKVSIYTHKGTPYLNGVEMPTTGMVKVY